MRSGALLGLLLFGAAALWVAYAAPELPAFGRWVGRGVSRALMVRRAEVDLAQAELYWLSAPAWIALRWGLSAVAGLLGYLLFGLPVMGIAAALATYHLLGLGLESIRRRAEARRQRALLDAIRLGVSVMAGSGGALHMLRSLSETGPLEARPIFARMVREAGTDSSLLGAVERTRERLADPLFDDLSVQLAQHWRYGGTLVPPLKALAADWTANLQLRREATALRAGIEASARVLTAILPVLLLTLHLVAPQMLDPLLTPTGEVLLAVLLALNVVGYRVLQRMSESPREERIALRATGQ